mmetsp:Transcript_35722/g.54667  ORF Transcript_35722/g.54667 Transcript_35722/m.54667 type:complete len:177 (+) Transcript_35722:15-545(+)
MSKTQSVAGWNWGYYHMKDDKLEVTEDPEGQKKQFSLNYKDIAISNASKHNEVTLEFQEESKRSGDFLCELRFFLPNRSEEQEEADKKSKQDGEESEEEVTAAKILSDKIIKHAGLGEQAGEMICQFQDLPLIVPRGKYTFHLYKNYCKIHGSTHAYKIMYKDILKMFLLQKVDRD